MGSHGGGRWDCGVLRFIIWDCPPFLILELPVLGLLRTVAVSSLFRFSEGVPGAVILVVIFYVKFSVGLWQSPSSLGNGIVGLDIRKFREF